MTTLRELLETLMLAFLYTLDVMASVITTVNPPISVRKQTTMFYNPLLIFWHFKVFSGACAIIHQGQETLGDVNYLKRAIRQEWKLVRCLFKKKQTNKQTKHWDSSLKKKTSQSRWAVQLKLHHPLEVHLHNRTAIHWKRKTWESLPGNIMIKKGKSG